MIDAGQIAFLTQRIELPLWFVLVLAAYSNQRIVKWARRARPGNARQKSQHHGDHQ